MVVVHCIPGLVDWQMNIQDDQSGFSAVRISLTSADAVSRPTEAEVLPRIDAQLKAHPIRWIEPRDGAWRIDLDELRRELAGFDGLDWLTGIIFITPEAGIDTRTVLDTRIDSMAVRFYIDSGVASRSKKRAVGRVFVVHGHDDGAREGVARVLEQAGFEVVLLLEQPSRGRTIIEKVEAYSDVSAAVVLLTADDRGGKAQQSELTYRPRARQNVIFELGYFCGRLGRDKVIALVRDGVELPSDYDGVVYIPLDANGGWKEKLLRDLRDHA